MHSLRSGRCGIGRRPAHPRTSVRIFHNGRAARVAPAIRRKTACPGCEIAVLCSRWISLAANHASSIAQKTSFQRTFSGKSASRARRNEMQQITSLLAPSPQFEMASLTGVPAGRSLRWVALSPCGYDARVVSSSAIAYRPSSKHDPGFLLEEASGRQAAKGCAPCSAPFEDTRSNKALSKS